MTKRGLCRKIGKIFWLREAPKANGEGLVGLADLAAGSQYCMTILMMKPVWRALVGALIVFGANSSWGAPQGRVSLSQASFISPDYHQTIKKDYQFVGAGFDTLSDVRHESEIEDTLQAQIRGVVAPGTSVMNYLNVSQLFWKQDLLSVGRKKINWSELDEDFGLGVYQPLFKWNPLQWESQGLTGVFLHLEPESQIPWGVTFFGSPFFIPNQGAGFEVQDGTFKESNPYFKAPPTMASVNDKEFNINYNVQKPDTQDVVFRQSFAGRVFLGDSEKGGFGQISYANKPMNELNLAFQGYAPPEDQKVNVDILPAVSNHNVASLDLHYSGSNFRTGISALHEDPKEPTYTTEWTYASFSSSTLVSPFVEFRARGLEVHLATLSVDGGESTGHGPESNQANKFIPQRYPFRNAGLLGAKYQFRMKRFENLGISTRYLRGESGEFDVWLTQASYQWRQGWAVSFTGQLVAVEPNDKGQKTAYNSYVDNDLFAVGVSYVF